MTTFQDAGPATRRRRRRAPMLMAWGMLLVAAAVFGVFIYQASGFGDSEHSLATGPQAGAQQQTATGKTGEAADQERFAVAGSEVGGFDDEQQPYTISAELARQDKQQPNLVHMNKVSGLLRRTDGRQMNVTAANGLFNTTDKTLMLDGNVAIVLQNTFTASMAVADVDVQKKALTSDADVLVELEGGQIFSTGIEVSDNGAHVIFRSRVRAQFEDPSPASPAAAVPAGAASSSSSKGNLQQ
jgi:hypothetical protein